MRLTGPTMSRAFIDGVLDRGADVIDIGLASTDQLWFASGHLGLPGAMFTASHNPGDYNGVKFCLRHAAPIDPGTAEGDRPSCAGRSDATGRDPRHPDRAGSPRRLRRPPPRSRRPHRHPAPDRGRRRRQRHGRSHATGGARRPEPEVDRALHRPGRQLPESPAEPARAREPGRCATGGPRPERGSGAGLRRRRRPLLRHRRDRRGGQPFDDHRHDRQPGTRLANPARRS